MQTYSHPGTALKAFIDGERLTVKDAAKEIGVAYLTLWNIVNAKSAITPPVAAAIERWKKTHLPGAAWLYSQCQYDVEKAAVKAAEKELA
ncbi:hypothetical protein [Caballeronia sp. LZ035]|uniref:helix-turn-helix transcriptional regulator n=1 Tax=Caballeronia sp. LZ035 TaxID=3038568 RepID=UPI00285A8E4D|nr:hypothetical protein [Caballeronia sp. LZ035]MDR5757657.1 hypothetical protein [Caballeronia sp. LZ035]